MVDTVLVARNYRDVPDRCAVLRLTISEKSKAPPPQRKLRSPRRIAPVGDDYFQGCSQSAGERVTSLRDLLL